MDGDDRDVMRALEFESDASVANAVVGLVKARDVHLTDAGAGIATMEGNLSILNGGCGPVLAGGDVTIRNGGCGPMMIGGDASIEYGGTQAMMAAGGATIGPRALVGVVVAPKVTIQEGGKVLLNTGQAVAFGAAAGVVFAIVSRLIRR